MKSKWLISVGLVVCLVMTFALPMCAPAPAPPVEEEKPPVVEEEELAKSIKSYMPINPDVNVAVVKFVDKNLGVHIRQQYMSTGEVTARLMAEAPHFSADIVVLDDNPGAYRAKREGWCIPYDSPAWWDVDEAWKDPDNLIFKVEQYSCILIGNKNLLDEASYTLPESWDDLLDPKWKGQIVIPSAAASGNGFQLLYDFMALYGFNKDLTGQAAEDAGWKYMEALDKNIAQYTRSGSAPADLVGRGEYMLGCTQGVNVLPRIELGYPLVYGFPKEGIGYSSSYLYILKGTKEVYTCQKVVDLLGSREFCEMLTGFGGHLTKFPGVAGGIFAGEMPPYISNLREIETWATDNKPRLLDEWKERFLRPE